jgi:sec-independent protein translocase protein TatA
MPGPTELIIILLILLLIFGTKKLRSLGGDLGSAIKGFKNAVSDDTAAEQNPEQASPSQTSENPETDKS